MVDRTVNVSADLWIATGGGTNFGNGKGDYLHLGKSVMSDGSTPLQQRVLLKFDLSTLFAGLITLSAGTLQLKVVPSATACDTQGGNPKFFVERFTDDAAENGQNSNCGLSSSSGANTKWGVDAHPITTHRALYSGSPAGNALININILTLLQDALALFDPDDESTHTLWLRLIACDGAAYDESAASRRIAFWSLQSSQTPASLSITGSDDHTAQAPTDLSPGATTINEGDAMTISGTLVDDDEGDWITRVDWELASDGAGVTVLNTGNFVPTGTKPTTFSKKLTGAGFNADSNPTRYWRSRTWDKAGTGAGVPTPPWSGWTGPVVLNTTPGKPLSFAIDTDSLTPHVRSTLNDADTGATLSAVRTVVEEDTSAGVVGTYDSGWNTTSGTRTDEVIPSSAGLQWGIPYRVRQWHKDNTGRESLVPDWVPVTFVQSVGPSAMSPKDINTALTSQHPTFTIGHSVAFNYYEAEFAQNSDGSGPLYDQPATSVGSTTSYGYVYPGAALVWGRVGYWRSKVRATATGNWTDWSEWVPFYVQALPRAIDVRADPSTTQQWVENSAGTLVFDSLTPDLYASFAEADADAVQPYNQVATRRELEIRRTSDAALIGKIVKSIDLTAGLRANRLLRFNTAAAFTGTAHVAVTDETGAGLQNDGTSMKMNCTGVVPGAPELVLGPRFDLNGEYTDLSSSIITAFKTYIRASTLTNLAGIRVRFHTGGNDANYNEWAIIPSVANALEQKTLTKATPSATGGTPNMAQVHRISVAVYAVTGNYTGLLYIDDLTLVGFDTLDTPYSVKVRFFDGNSDNVWGPWSDNYQPIKPSAAPTVGAGTAPDTTDPTPTIAHTYSGSSGKAQRQQTIRLYSGTGGSKVLMDTFEVAGTGLTYVLPEDLLDTAMSYTAEVDGVDIDGLLTTVTITWGPTAFLIPHRLYSGTTAGGANTTLAAAASLAATNIRLTSVANVSVGDLLRIGSGNSTVVVEVVGPVDASGVFNGTSGAGGTGADLAAGLDIAQSNGAAVVEVDAALVATGASDSRVTIAWAASSLTAAHYSAVEIERQNIDGTWSLAGRVTDKAVLTFTDRDAPVGRTARYRVTQTNGWASSPAAYGETLQVPDSETGGWFYIGAITFDIHLVTDWSRNPRVIDEVLDGIGREFPMVNKYNTEGLAYEGTIGIVCPAAYDYQRIEFERASRSSAAVTIKNGKGEVYRVVLTGVKSSPDAVWTETVTFGWTQVE